MGSLLSSERDIAALNLSPALGMLFALEQEGLDLSWLPGNARKELEEAFAAGGSRKVSNTTIPMWQMAQALNISGKSDSYSAVRCMLTRWLRANGYTKGFIRNYLSAYTGLEPQLSTIEKWCEGVGFQMPWPSRTESQPLRGGPEEYEAQRKRWQKMVGDTRELIRNTRRGVKAARSYHRMAEAELKGEIIKTFHKIALHQMSGPDREKMERVMTYGAVADLMEEIAHQHARGVTLIEKPLEDGLAHAFQVGSELDLRPRSDRTAKADIEIVELEGDLKMQVKSSAAYSPEKQQDHAQKYENETRPFEFTLFSTGNAKSQDTERMAREAAGRIDNIDVYMLANVIHEDQGLTPGNTLDTTKYAIDTLHRDAKVGIAKSLRKHDFAQSKSYWVEGTVERGGKPVPWRAEAYLEPSSNSVKLRNISAACMETVATITVPSPEACQAIIGAKSYRMYRDAKAKLAEAMNSAKP